MEPYVGEIRLFAGEYAPEDWLLCQGQLLAIREYQVLYALLGTIYGGDGSSTFGIPNLSARLPVGRSNSAPPTMANTYKLGSPGGVFGVTLAAANLPTHTHTLSASKAAATTTTPGPSVVFATAPASFTYYAVDTTRVNAAAEMVASSGSTSPSAHVNMMPTLGLSYIIATKGIYPTPA